MKKITIEDVNSVAFRKTTEQEDILAQSITIANGSSAHMPSDALMSLMRARPEDIVVWEVKESDPAILDDIDENTV